MNPSPITVKLVGGLGNQLFIWATAFHLRRTRDLEVILDASECTEWGNQIGDFGINVDVPGPMFPDGLLPGRFKANANLIVKILRKLRQVYRSLRIGKIYWESPKKSFDATIFEIPSGKELRGYFQSYKYFNDSAGEIRELLANPVRPSQEFNTLLGELPDSWLAVHMRLGPDYKVMQERFGILGTRYFHEALQYIEEGLPNLPVYVFSDDIELAREVLPGCHRYIGKAQLHNPAERLIVMSHARGFIGSNSSFSWWAAFLNRDSKAIKVFPDPWFLDSSVNLDDLLPPDWIRINRL